MADEKTIYKMKTPSGDPVRVEEAWKDANGELLTEKVNKADAQTITGLKTFATLPQSSATPTNDADLATKKYSDDLWATRKAQEEKCYQAMKTVTKDFTRTDPVYVRIGDDGEPEIHYTMTQANGNSYLANMDLGNATLCIHNGRILTSIDHFAVNTKLGAIWFDDTSNVTYARAFIGLARVSHGVLGDIDLSNADIAPDYSYYKPWVVVGYPTKFRVKGLTQSHSLSAWNLNHDDLLWYFENLGEAVESGVTTLTLGSAKLALMSDEEKAIATEKGWTLA